MADQNTTENVFRFIHLRPATGNDQTPVFSLTPSTPLTAPGSNLPASRTTSGSVSGGAISASAQMTDSEASRINAARLELTALAQSNWLRLPADDTAAESGGTLFALNESGLNRLSAATRSVLDDLGLDAETQPVDSIVTLLEAEDARSLARGGRPDVVFATPNDPPETLPYIRDIGIADLLVIKQHLRAYERVDIAHVESVMIGEKKSRNHRALERVEETITIERETTEEKQTELTTAERFELNRETARTAKRDQEFGFGLTVSGKYGPTVDFSSNLAASTTSSTEETAKSATHYAKDIVERSLERVVERVRTEQVRRVLREQEETNLHELENKTGKHINGVYQFLEKVYESQVFNYGIRQMFDFMVPEPASFVWYLEKTETKLSLPPPPVPLESVAPTAASINEGNYLELAAKLGADGVESPPPVFLTTGTAIAHGQDGASEEGQPRSIIEKDFALPPGYRPFRAVVRPLALTDDSLTLALTIGHVTRVWKPAQSELTDVGSGHRIGAGQLDLFLSGSAYDSQSKVPLHTLAFETNSFSLSIEIICKRTDEAYVAWQLKTYDKLLNAYRDTIQKYEAKVADLKAQAEAQAAKVNARFGAPPSQNAKIVKGELKKHCISIVTRQRYEQVSAVEDGDPPFFGFINAAEQGAFTRFFEQALEWDQMQYVFYPYYWARKKTWASRFTRDEVDTEFLDFLQAGAARVVVPVRPGFEIPLTHYLETLEIWNGEGDLPTIKSPLYVPIIKEIQERTGAPQGEVPVGEPWTTRVPTPLVILRNEEQLPKWHRVDETKWEWEEGAAKEKAFSQ